MNKQNAEQRWDGDVSASKVESLTQEMEMKNKYISDLEGDMKQLKSMNASENMQYMRHTLVKFLCDSTRSEKSKIAPAVAQLLEMTYSQSREVMARPEESSQMEKNFGLNQRGWFFYYCLLTEIQSLILFPDD